jgi:hypothetical protein
VLCVLTCSCCLPALQVNLYRQAGVFMFDRMAPHLGKQLGEVIEKLIQVGAACQTSTTGPWRMSDWPQ